MPSKHPSGNFIKYLLVQDPQIAEAAIQRRLEEWGFLSADPQLLPLMRAEMPAPPPNFNPADRTDRDSVRYLRNVKVYEMFHPNDDMMAALDLLAQPDQRLVAEQIIMSRIDMKIACKRVNEAKNWHLSEGALRLYRHYFWDVDALTFDEWGRFLYGRASYYERYMCLLTAPPRLAFYHLRIDQSIESKRMIEDVQKIAHEALLEAREKPGINSDKAKMINLLGKVIIEAHNALATSDMALKDTLKQFEQWRMEHPQIAPTPLHQLAPAGNFSNSGIDPAKKKDLKN